MDMEHSPIAHAHITEQPTGEAMTVLSTFKNSNNKVTQRLQISTSRVMPPNPFLLPCDPTNDLPHPNQDDTPGQPGGVKALAMCLA